MIQSLATAVPIAQATTMKKFGLGKKGDGEEDSSRLALFGSRGKSKSPAPPSHNPYAQPSAPPDPYTQAKMHAGLIPTPNAGQGPPPGLQQPRGYGSTNQVDSVQGARGGESQHGAFQNGYGQNNNTGTPRGGYGGGGYSSNRFGNQSAYGADKFGNSQSGNNPYAGVSQTGGTSKYGPGGYGGLGRTNSNETLSTEVARDALFGDAKQRVQQSQQNGAPSFRDTPSEGADPGGSYGAYGDRQLTTEEEEEEDVLATKQEIRFMKQQDVSSTRNALRIAAQAEETGRNTLARLGAQGERIHNTERNLDMAANHNRDAEDKARELKTLNRSMWAVHMNNPFTGKERRERRDQEITEKHRTEREQREASRQQAFHSTKRMENNFRGLQGGPEAPKSKASLAERAKYQFEADSEDDELENEIDSNLDELSGAAARLNMLARATGEEVEAQNKHLERIGVKVSDLIVESLNLLLMSTSERSCGRPAPYEYGTTQSHTLT